MAGSWRVGRVLGVELRIDSSWVLVAILVVYSFYLQLTTAFERLATSPGVVLALATAALFFGSVLVHEMAHALLAIRRGIEVRGITLFLFGGATHARVESRGPRDEFVVSAVGPASSLAMAGLLGGIGLLGRGAMPEAISGALLLLGWLNLLLAVFNLLPGFPLDGGRLLRSAIWSKTGNLTRATRIASLAGQALGYLMIAGGLLLTLSRRVGGGLWFAAIGWFLAQAAHSSFEELRTREMLRDVKAEDVMQPQTEAGSPLEGGLPSTHPDAPVGSVLTALRETSTDRVLVVRDERVVGVITQSGLADWLRRRRKTEKEPT